MDCLRHCKKGKKHGRLGKGGRVEDGIDLAFLSFWEEIRL